MRKNEFEQKVLAFVSEYLGEGYDVKIDHVKKDNAASYRAVIIGKDSLKISSTLNIDQLFFYYHTGTPFFKIAEEVRASLDKQLIESKWLNEQVQGIEDFSKMSSKVIYRLVNYEKNEMELTYVPHRRLEDLAVVYCLLVGQIDGQCVTASVSCKLMETWQVDEEVLYQAAYVNTPRLFPMEFEDMGSIMEGILMRGLGLPLDNEMSGLNVQVSVQDHSDVRLFMLSNNIGSFGASVVLYPQALSLAAERLGSDLVIFPSSIHEVLVIPLDERADLAFFREMVRNVNDEEVALQEVLSDQVYCYIREEGKFRLMTEADVKRCRTIMAA